jgi:hypothetical protein
VKKVAKKATKKAVKKVAAKKTVKKKVLKTNNKPAASVAKAFEDISVPAVMAPTELPEDLSSLDEASV